MAVFNSITPSSHFFDCTTRETDHAPRSLHASVPVRGTAPRNCCDPPVMECAAGLAGREWAQTAATHAALQNG